MPVDEEGALRRRLQWFMGGRLLVATLLLGGTLLLAVDDRRGFASFTPRFLLGLIIATYAASAVFAATLPRVKKLALFAAIQIGWDLGLTTGLIYIVGGASSGFTFLYGTAILMAAIIIGPAATRATAFASLVLYTGLSIGLASGYIAHAPDQPYAGSGISVADLTFAVVRTLIGLTLVGVLAGNLSARLHRQGGELQRAAASAAELAKLNEDIVRSLSSGLVTTDPQGVVVAINPAGVEMLGGDEARIVGQPLAKFFSTSGRPSQRPASGTPTGSQRGEAIGTRPNGTTFPLGYTRTPLVSADGSIHGSLIVFQDLTEVALLKEAAERAERLAALGRLSAGLAHEIRNPLSAISGSVELVRESTRLDNEEQRLLGIVIGEVDRLADLVTTMLEVSRPREPQRGEVDLRAIAADVIAVARRTPRSPVKIELLPEGSERAVIAWADGGQMRQVLWNLLKNALQASPPEGTVRVLVVEDQRGDAIIEVSDEGRGVEAQSRSRLFELFYTGRAGGVGLGLALVKQIVDAHRGSVEVLDTATHGATFRVTIPGVATARATKGDVEASEGPRSDQA